MVKSFDDFSISYYLFSFLVGGVKYFIVNEQMIRLKHRILIYLQNALHCIPIVTEQTTRNAYMGLTITNNLLFDSTLPKVVRTVKNFRS